MKFTPQEIEVWYVLPEIRKQLALSLKRLGLSQKQVSQKLGVSAATISHYARNRRAGNFDLGSQLKKPFEAAAKKIAKTDSKTEIMHEIQGLCRAIRNSCILCKIHKEIETVPCNCRACMR
ncbi:MAG: helix-turn-helix domain-containing protein [Candidatus Woesearchaeota archaeon]